MKGGLQQVSCYGSSGVCSNTVQMRACVGSVGLRACVLIRSSGRAQPAGRLISLPPLLYLRLIIRRESFRESSLTDGGS